MQHKLIAHLLLRKQQLHDVVAGAEICLATLFLPNRDSHNGLCCLQRENASGLLKEVRGYNAAEPTTKLIKSSRQRAPQPS